MKPTLLKTLAMVLLSALVFIGSWHLLHGGKVKLKEPVREYNAKTPNPTRAPLALGPDGYYWGVTHLDGEKAGYVYKMKADGSEWKMVHTFMQKDSERIGIDPVAGLVYDGVDSMLGTITRSLDGSGFGTIYKINTTTEVLTTLVEFTQNDGLYKGRYPQAPLVNDGRGSYWGTMTKGGTHDMGTIFNFHPATGVLTTVAEMPLPPFPQYGWGGLRVALVNDGMGYWWGTTPGVVPADCGTVFKVNAATGELMIVLEFTEGKGGTHPDAGLVSDGQGYLWGTCSQGGLRWGTLFKINATTGALMSVVEFTGKGGRNLGQAPEAVLISDGRGFLWGSTSSGGRGDAGTLFKVDIGSGLLTTLVEFERNASHNKGCWPKAPLVSDGHGAFLGTTPKGGKKDAGTIFKVDIATGVLTTLVEFGKVGL